jgi:hypothetical protein
MRNPFVSTLAIALIAGAILALSLTTDLGHIEDSESLPSHDAMSTERTEEWPAETFFVDTASWDEESGQLIVRAKTLQAKGTFLTLSGIPASTWVDAFRISSDHAADFQLPLSDGQAIPCQVTVRSAFASMVVRVKNAPSACRNLLEIEGTVTTEAGLPLTSGRVMATVGGSVFTTTTDPAGNYKLELYSESDDAFVGITAEGRIGTELLEWQIYKGSISGLRGSDGLHTNVWATELFGRNYGRLLLAETTPD